MQRLTVDLGSRSYSILIGAGLLGESTAYDGALGDRSLVVTSEAVADLHLASVRSALAQHPHEVVVLPDGDAAKTLATVERLCGAAATAGLDRGGTFIALGGGAIGDVTGLAASLYQRGVPYLQLPTTLLAQVDSSVGGKTAVNHAVAKNLIGTFHQPSRVIADVATLRTLPARELRSGLGEVIKYAVLEGEAWMADLEREMAGLLARDEDALAATVARCCAAKSAVVAADERDVGARVNLNLGHSFGHALETAFEGALLHGEAVALGCVMAARLSQSLGWLPARDAARISALTNAADLPVLLPSPAPSAEHLLEIMQHDKKAARGVVRLVLLRALGEPVFTGDYPHAALVLMLRDFTMQP
ncbi:MAG: 3-dehydroquinate synthase [Gammaproteobacteria bacterium]